MSNKWIKINSAFDLPNGQGMYFVVCKGRIENLIYIATFSIFSKRFKDLDGDDLYRVTHYMLLEYPELPKDIDNND